jgi:hypothetical protein
VRRQVARERIEIDLAEEPIRALPEDREAVPAVGARKLFTVTR